MTSCQSLGNQSQHTLTLEEQPLSLRQRRRLLRAQASSSAAHARLFPSVPAGDRKGRVIVEGLLSTLGLSTVALLFCCCLKSRVGWYL